MSVETFRETMINQFFPVRIVNVALFLRDSSPRCVTGFLFEL